MIEVEKKFILTSEQEKKLIEGAEFLGEKQFTDAYYDDKDFSLTKQDIWLRERDGKCELKLPLNESSENRVSDQYRELDAEADILAYFGAQDVSIQDLLVQRGYIAFCKITTTRRKYKKEDFGIDLDIMDFGYTLAEIESMIEDESKIKEATQAIVEFAKKYDLDINVIVKGKVMTYLERNNPKHYQSLLDAWQL